MDPEKMSCYIEEYVDIIIINFLYYVKGRMVVSYIITICFYITILLDK